MKIKPDTKTPPCLMALEPRIMYDAAVSACLNENEVDTQNNSKHPADSASPPDQCQGSLDLDSPDSLNYLFDHYIPVDSREKPTQIFIIDGNIPSLQQLIRDVPGNSGLIILDPSQNSLDQITDQLAAYHDLDAIHIISHGQEGQINLGDTFLNAKTLENHESQIQDWGRSLTKDGDILLYGCRVAQGEQGKFFIEQLSEITLADIAASTDTSGHQAFGGDWDLEYTIGNVEKDNIISWPQYYGALGEFEFYDSGQSIDIGQTEGGALGDFDGDGDLDVFLVNTQDPDKVYFNDGNGNFTDSGQALGGSGDFGQEVAVGDLDGDGDLDAYVVISGAMDRVYINDGSGFFTDSVQSLSSESASAITLGDLDGDGDLDAYIANYGDNQVYENDGTGTFSLLQTLTASGSSEDVDLADLDGDGDLDAFVANWDNEPNEIWNNDGTGHFSLMQTVGSSVSMGVSLGDVDDDGNIDAFVANLDTQADKVWLNDGTGTATAFSDSGQNLGSSYSYGVKLEDVDQDGDLDAFVVGGNYWENDGTGVFVSTDFATVGQEVLFGDVDDDGDTDAFLVRRWDNRLWFNNARPTLVSGNIATYIENDPPVTVDGGITLIDDDSADMAGATITISDNYIPGKDFLSFTPSGSISGSWDTAAGTLTLSGTESIGNYQIALLSVTFASNADDPAAGGGLSREISFNVDDGISTSHWVTSTVNITPVNDPPYVHSGAQTEYTSNDPPVVIDNSIDITDDNPDLTHAKVNIGSNYIEGKDFLDFTPEGDITGVWNPASATLVLSGTDSVATYQSVLRSVRFGSTADDPAAGGGLSRTIVFEVDDGTYTDAATSTINITPADVSPVIISGAVTGYTENAEPVRIDNAIELENGDNDIHHAHITINTNYIINKDILNFTPVGSISGVWNAATATLTLSGTDSGANYQTALRSVTFESSADDPAAGGGLSRTIVFEVDNGTDTATADSTINITPVNDYPVIVAGAVTPYMENDPPTIIDNGIILNDKDNSDLAGAQITINSNYIPNEDILKFTATGSITGVWDPSLATLTLSGRDSVANYQAALRTVTFESSTDNPAAAGGLTRTIGFQVDDGISTSEIATSIVNFTPVNDPPVIVSGAVTPYMENGSPVLIDGDITISDDSPAVVQSRISISDHYMEGADFLSFTPVGSITGTWDARTATLTLSGTDTIANYQTALRSVTFKSTADDPAAGGGLSRTISFDISDGLTESVDTATINITPVNDAPVADMVPHHEIVYYNSPVMTNGFLLADEISGDHDRDGDPIGIAVIGADNTYGKWQYSLDGGAVWINFGSLSDTNATLLSPTPDTRIRFSPNDPAFTGKTMMKLRIWDQSEGTHGQTGVNTSHNGGITPYSVGVETVSFDIYGQVIQMPPESNLATNSEFQEINTDSIQDPVTQQPPPDTRLINDAIDAGIDNMIRLPELNLLSTLEPSDELTGTESAQDTQEPEGVPPEKSDKSDKSDELGESDDSDDPDEQDEFPEQGLNKTSEKATKEQPQALEEQTKTAAADSPPGSTVDESPDLIEDSTAEPMVENKPPEYTKASFSEQLAIEAQKADRETLEMLKLFEEVYDQMQCK